MIYKIPENLYINPVNFNMDFSEILLTPEDVQRSLGYKTDNTPLPIRHILDDTFPKLGKLVKLQAGYTILDPDKISFEKDRFFYNSLEFDCKAIIGKRLIKSDTLVIFLVSIGHDLERWSKELMFEGDILKGYVVDTIGSELAERAAGWVERKIENKINAYNWKTTNRYSPGYCGWYVMEQKKIFSLLPENFCGVSLTESALMIPIKSVSGVIGIGGNVKKEEYECSLCDIEHCYKRNEQNQVEGIK